ncbi:ParB/RepB/Spo0J family partition protein [Selenomonas sp. KH1T6]|uniref:ParB/RepB/Spo0J family partition protein n=1 Tax=Selenomonas sp. KH1T6 TaxID=3158784 RepID=UPI0008A793DA|nr:Chromosome segregation protein Spo0J, contains ParB-like nuclease domain [Selenomonas ruminantium]
MKKQPAGFLEKLMKNKGQEGVSVERHIDIDVHDLVPNPNNFYAMRNIDRLKNLIRTTGKVEELTVKSVGMGKYMVVAGHRRRLAVLELLEEGANVPSRLPCSVVSFSAVGNKTAEEMELLWLSASNLGQREYRSMEEKIHEVETIGNLLRKDYDEDYAGGIVTGPFRSYLAKFLCMTDSSLQRLTAMRNVLPEYLEMVDRGEMKETAAYELTNLSESDQRTLMESLVGQEITVKSIRVRKAELFAVSEEPGNPKGAEAQNLFENESPVEENDCGTVEVEVGEGLEVMGDHQDTEDEDSPNEEPETVAEAVMTEDTPQETNTASTYRTSEGKQLMASVDRLMSYCEGRHDASDAPCNGCRFENGAGGCRMGTKPCEWLIETESRKMGM